MLVSGDRSEKVDAKLQVVCWKAELNEVQKEVSSCGLDMPIGVRPKHQLTLFCARKLKIMLRSGTSQHSHNETKADKDSLLPAYR
jgi:uncharacterized membrane protein YjjP (DUF1212 family)